MDDLKFFQILIKFFCNVTAVQEEEIGDDVKDSVLDLKPSTSHSEAGAKLSKCIDWFSKVQKQADTTQIILLRKIRNIAAQKAKLFV